MPDVYATRKVLGAVVLLSLTSSLLAPEARAQRANENAVTAASDAFGTVVGNQTIGLYSPNSARGFSPVQAQNLRIEGLYFDQQNQTSNPYVFSGTTMRIGVAAQSYVFPSPSGIADLHLRVPSDAPGASLVLQAGPFTGRSAEIDTQYPLIPGTLSAGLIVGAGHDFDLGYALTSERRAISLLARWRPSDAVEIVPFYGYIHNYERAETPFVFATGTDPLPLFDEQHLPTQAWSTWLWNQVTAGVIANAAIGGPWSVRGGVFRSEDRHGLNYNDLLVGLMPDGTAQQHLMDIVPPLNMRSWSGDLRLVHSSAQADHRRELMLIVRGRRVDRDFGGDSVTDLGQNSIYTGQVVPRPVPVFQPESHDSVRQSAVGLNYREWWQGRGSVSLGLLRTQYDREISDPLLGTSRKPNGVLLPTATVGFDPVRFATLYASYTRGLEDSSPAPPGAANRGEPPPATPTWQVDGGVRITLKSHLQFLLGGFRIHKGFFSLDRGNRYTQIGDISSTGIESSATWTGLDGLTLVAGAVWLRPVVTRNLDTLGGNGAVPIGPVPRTLSVNLDYAPAFAQGWGLSAEWMSWSSRVQTADDRHSLPPYDALRVGLRYVFRLFNRPASVRFDADNVTNAAGITISSGYWVVPQLRRNYTATMALDL